MEGHRTGAIAAGCSASWRGPSARRLHSCGWPSWAAVWLSVLSSFSCYELKLPPESTANPVSVAVRVNPAQGPVASYLDRYVGQAKLENVASSIRANLRKRRGLVVVDSPDSADVIVELRGYYAHASGAILVPYRLWGAVYAARDQRLPLWSSNAAEFSPRHGPVTLGGAVNHFADVVEFITADNFEVLNYLRGRPVGDTSPVEPTSSAPLQGEYRLTVAASPSCPAPSEGTLAMPSEYHVTLYQRGNTLLLLARGSGLNDCVACVDKVRGQVVGDAVSLRGAHAESVLLSSVPFRWVWTGKVTGDVREERIDAKVVGSVSLYRDGKHTNERIYNCEAADHRWTLTRRK